MNNNHRKRDNGEIGKRENYEFLASMLLSRNAEGEGVLDHLCNYRNREAQRAKSIYLHLVNIKQTKEWPKRVQREKYKAGLLSMRKQEARGRN